MKLTRLGRYAIWKTACPFCDAARGEECRIGYNLTVPAESPVSWPNGVHYGTGSMGGKEEQYVRGIYVGSITELELKMFEAMELDNLD